MKKEINAFIATIKKNEFVSTAQIYNDFIDFDYILNKGKYSRNVQKYILGNRLYFIRLLANYLNESGYKWERSINRAEIKIHETKVNESNSAWYQFHLGLAKKMLTFNPIIAIVIMVLALTFMIFIIWCWCHGL